MPARPKPLPFRELVVRVPLGQTVVVRFEPEPPPPLWWLGERPAWRGEGEVE